MQYTRTPRVPPVPARTHRAASDSSRRAVRGRRSRVVPARAGAGGASGDQVFHVSRTGRPGGHVLARFINDRVKDKVLVSSFSAIFTRHETRDDVHALHRSTARHATVDAGSGDELVIRVERERVGLLKTLSRLLKTLSKDALRLLKTLSDCPTDSLPSDAKAPHILLGRHMHVTRRYGTAQKVTRTDPERSASGHWRQRHVGRRA